MATTIVRYGSVLDPITLTNSVNTSEGFSLSTEAGAMIMVTSKTAPGNITITFYAKADGKLPDTYMVVDTSGNPIAQMVTAAGQCFPLPDQLFAARHVVPVVSTGTAVVRIVTKG